MLTAVAMGLGAGVVLGGLYFAGLWLTTRRIPESRHPGLLVAVSYLARLALLGAGLVGVVRLSGAPALLAALLGVMAARHLIVSALGPHRGTGARGGPGASGARRSGTAPLDGSGR